ncbi:hypothetical protein ACFLZH_00050 [Patescibacteria group bacterium]
MKKTIFILALIFVFISSLVVAGNWYFSTYIENKDEPPKLILSAEKFQGELIDKTHGFLQFQQSDEDRFIKNKISAFLKANKGVNFFNPKTNLTFDEILYKAIEPRSDLKVLIAFYNYETSEFNAEDCFLVYPPGPYTNTCPVPRLKLSEVVIPENNGFIIIANEGFNYDSSLIAYADTLANPYVLDFKDNEEGWTLRPLAPNTKYDDSQIEKIWLQKDQNEFEQIHNFTDIDLSRKYKMAWIKIEIIEDRYILR